MSLWGMNDGKTVAGVVVTAANATVVGTFAFTNFEVGDFLNVGKNDYVITAIADATVMTVRAEIKLAEHLKVHRQTAPTLFKRKALSVAYASVGLDANNVYGVDVGEMEGSTHLNNYYYHIWWC